jgi:hypothetical protein
MLPKYCVLEKNVNENGPDNKYICKISPCLARDIICPRGIGRVREGREGGCGGGGGGGGGDAETRTRRKTKGESERVKKSDARRKG